MYVINSIYLLGKSLKLMVPRSWSWSNMTSGNMKIPWPIN